MKRCKNCNSIVNDSDRFCSNCGNSNFYFEHDSEEQPVQFLTYVENKRGDRKQISYTLDAEGQHEPVNKSKKISKIIGIIFAGFLLFLALGLTLNIINEDSNQDEYYDSYQETEKIANYSKGNVIDGIYKNEWADIQFDISDNWEEGDDSEYAEIENEIIDCGFYGKKGANTITLTFINTGDDTEGIEEEYLVEYLAGISGAMEDAEITESSYEMIGNYAYLHSDASGYVNNYELFISAYIRRLDNYIILLSVTGDSVESNRIIVEGMESFTDF